MATTEANLAPAPRLERHLLVIATAGARTSAKLLSNGPEAQFASFLLTSGDVMAARSIASLSLSFGLVSIPVRLYSATSASETISFNLLAPDGSRVQQQYVSKATGKAVERAEMQKGYEFEKEKFVVFTKDELKALEESPSHIVEILAFLPDRSIDPVYYDKAYFIAPDKRGGKPYSLLKKALLASERCALASWNWKGKTHMVQVRATDDGLIFQRLLWGDAVRSLKDLDIEDASYCQIWCLRGVA
jgi:DNA end-binding protein Ku